VTHDKLSKIGVKKVSTGPAAKMQHETRKTNAKVKEASKLVKISKEEKKLKAQPAKV